MPELTDQVQITDQRALRVTTALAAAFMAFTAWDQSHWWLSKSDYAFGWLVPCFVAYVLYERWAEITKACGVKQSGAGAMVEGRARQSRLWAIGAVVGMLGGGALFLLGAFLRAAAGASYPASLAIALGAGAVILGMVAQLGRVQPWALVRLWVFPAAVWLLSAPMISVVENTLSLFLLGKITSTVCFVFDNLGMAIEQQGNVLVLPTGQVGVAEACSGIRSLMGCLFAGAFLSAVSFARTWKKIALLVSAMLFAVCTNMLRGLFLTAYAYRHGPEAIAGRVHDTAGYAVLGVTVAGLMLMVQVLSLRVRFGRAGSGDDQSLPS